MQTYLSKNVTAAGDNVIARAGDTKTPHVLATITILKADAHAVAIYDGESAATGTLIGTLKASAPEGTYHFHIGCTKGICLTPAASFAGDIQVSYV